MYGLAPARSKRLEGQVHLHAVDSVSRRTAARSKHADDASGDAAGSAPIARRAAPRRPDQTGREGTKRSCALVIRRMRANDRISALTTRKAPSHEKHMGLHLRRVEHLEHRPCRGSAGWAINDDLRPERCASA